jgi:hypothetical protein
MNNDADIPFTIEQVEAVAARLETRQAWPEKKESAMRVSTPHRLALQKKASRQKLANDRVQICKIDPQTGFLRIRECSKTDIDTFFLKGFEVYSPEQESD